MDETTQTGLWQWWKRTARKLGDAQARLVLSVFYFLIMAPFALVIRFCSDPLRIRHANGWIRRSDPPETTVGQAREQY
jgi:hypothetical protein